MSGPLLPLTGSFTGRTPRSIPWTLVRTAGPVGPSVSVDDLKLYLRLPDDTDDMIADLGAAAEEAIESELSVALLTQSWELRLGAFPVFEIRLPRPPLASVTSVQYLDLDGNTVTLDPALYVIDLNARPGRIYPALNQIWPSTLNVPNAVTVAYVAGVAIAESVPGTIRTAVKLMVGDLYENRERSAEQALLESPLYAVLCANSRCLHEFHYRR